MAKGQNFNQDDHRQLCRSWIHISQDAATGTNQKGDAFWVRVCKHFNESASIGQPRSQRSLQTKWSEIQHDVQKFTGAHALAMNQKKVVKTQMTLFSAL